MNTVNTEPTNNPINKKINPLYFVALFFGLAAVGITDRCNVKNEARAALIKQNKATWHQPGTN